MDNKDEDSGMGLSLTVTMWALGLLAAALGGYAAFFFANLIVRRLW